MIKVIKKPENDQNATIWASENEQSKYFIKAITSDIDK